MAETPRGLIIAAPSSGSGKTTTTLGLLRALRRRGTSVQPFKCGPDYIDPAFHAAAAGRASINLDTWAMRPQLIASLAVSHGSEAELSIAEGAMGLFDGAGVPGHFGNGAAADLAALTGWPVILVLDVAAQAETAAAIVLGCKTLRSDVPIAGVILNSIGGDYHRRLIEEAIAKLGVPVLGALRRNRALSLPERHLGLLQARETTAIDARMDVIADAIDESVDLDAVCAAAMPLKLASDALPVAMEPPGQRIALAHDAAFSFFYPHILSGWRRAGAEVSQFSPLADEAPPADCDAIWLPGGYPELHADTLAHAQTFKAGMRAAAQLGVPIHGECGGYMVLGTGLEASDGDRWEMLGLLSLETTFAKRQLHLGYRRARFLGANVSTKTGGEAMGHEFHFASIVSNSDKPLAVITDAGGAPIADGGARRGNVSGSFFHLIDCDS